MDVTPVVETVGVFIRFTKRSFSYEDDRKEKSKLV